jgi:uncharacterized membrane protein YkoI
MQYRILQSVLVVVLIVGLSGCAGISGQGAEEEAPGQEVSLSELPAPARATIDRLIAGGQIKTIEKEQKDGKAIYDVEATVQGKDVEYDVADDGTVLSSGESVAYASVPAAVQAAAEKYFGSAAPLKAFKEVEAGETFYEIEGTKGSVMMTLKLTAAGQIVEEEEE